MSTADLIAQSAAAEAPALSPMEAVMKQALEERGIPIPADVTPQADPLGAFAPPATPGGYHFDQVPDEHYDQAFETQMRTVLHDAGIDRGFAAELHRRYYAGLANPKSPEQIEAMKPVAGEALRKAWGDQWQQNLSVSIQFMEEIAAKYPSVVGVLEKNGLGSDPWVIRQLYSRAMARRGA